LLNTSEVVEVMTACPGRDHMADIYDVKNQRFFRFSPKPPIDGLTGRGRVIAILDTGLLSIHPDVKNRLVDQVDFTGEGVEDENGHGTKVALITLIIARDVGLISVKALSRDGTASPETLLRALQWLEQDRRAQVVNISAGVFRPLCRGDCDICEATRRVTQSGKIPTVAAGNRRGITSCPGKASDSVVTVTAVDAEGNLAIYASPATLEGVSARLPDGRGLWVSSTGAVA
jgi:subtilisin family serine protease